MSSPSDFCIGCMNDEYPEGLLKGISTLNEEIKTLRDNVLTFANAMYAKGARDMQKRAIKEAMHFAKRDGLYMANAIRALPITTNTEGEQG